MAYKAFISYSHAADGRLAPAVQSGLHRFARPWYRLRALHVFRDDTNLSASPGLWSSIERALDDSEYFILLASPLAAASKWVRREVEHWLARKSADRLLIALTEGEAVWDEAARDFDWAKTTALPTALGRAFDEEPLYLDFRGARTSEDLSLTNPEFRARIADLAATLHGRPKDEMIGLDVRQHRRTIRVAWSAGIALFALAVIAVGFWRVAETQRKEADRQRQVATARRLAAEAELSRSQEPVIHQRGLLLGLEAMRRLALLGQPAVEADRAVRGPLALSPRPLAALPTEIRRLALSPDGQLVATAGKAGTIQVLDAATGAERWRGSHSDVVTVLGWSADGRLVFTASTDATGRVWDGATGRELMRVSHAKQVYGAALSPDGRWLATGSLDGTARMWDLATGRELGRVFHQAGVKGLSFSADGRWLALTGADETMRLVEAATGRPIANVPHGPPTLGAVALSPDGQYVATRSHDVTHLWEIAKERRVARIREEPEGREQPGTWVAGVEWSGDAVAFSRDGRWLATAHRDRTARIYDAHSGAEVVRIRHGDMVAGVAWGPDGRWLVTRSGSGVRVLEVATGRDVARIESEGSVWAISVSADGRRLAVGGGGTARVWELDMRREVAAFPHESGTWHEVWSPDGRWLTSQCEPRTACLWDVGRVTIGSRMAHPDTLWASPRAVVWSPDARLLATTGKDRSVRLWDAATGQELSRLPHPLVPDDIVFTADGRRLATRSGEPGQEAGEARIWDVATGNETARIAPPGGVDALALAPHGKWLATVGRNHVLRIWDVAASPREIATVPDLDGVSPDHAGTRLVAWRGQTARILEAPSGRELARVAHDGRIVAAVFTSDGRWMITASEDRTARIWDGRSGKERARLGHEREVGVLALSADGRWLATGSGHPITGSGEARVWDLVTAREVARIPHERGVWVVAFSPDGRWLATRSREWPTRIWLWRPPDMIAAACARLTRNLTREEWRDLVGDEPYQPTCPDLR